DRVGYVLTPDERGIFRPRQPTDGHPLPVLVTPGIAAEAGPHGILPLQVEGQQVAGRVVGVVERFPSIVGEAVVADRTTASTMLDTGSPGLGTIDELWLNVPADRDAAAAVAIVLALLGLLLVVVGEVRDDRGELFDLEAQGASPATIRAHLRVRAALVAGFGTLGGIALGAILSALVISLVAVTAGATVPEPPLQLSLDLPLLALAVVGYLVVAALLVGV